MSTSNAGNSDIMCGTVDWQLVTARIARLGDQFLLQLPNEPEAVADLYGDRPNKRRERIQGFDSWKAAELVPALPTPDEVQDAVKDYMDLITSRKGVADPLTDLDADETSLHREKRARYTTEAPSVASVSELVRYLEPTSAEGWIGAVALQVALWANRLREASTPVLPAAIAHEEDFQRRAQMGVFATGEAPLVAPNPLLPTLVRCGTELGHKCDVFALFLACLVYPDRTKQRETMKEPEALSRTDAFCQHLARQVAETVFGLFNSALRHITTGAPIAEQSLMVSITPNASATAKTAGFMKLPPVLQARRALHFLAELANTHILDSEWFVRRILHDLLVEAALFGAEQDQAPLSRSQFLVELALDGLMHCGREAERVAADCVDAILQAAERFAGTIRSPSTIIEECARMERLFSPVKDVKLNSPALDEAHRASLQVSRRFHELLLVCRKLRARSWHCNLLPQYHLLFWETRIRDSGLRMQLPVPPLSRHSIDARYPVPSIRLHITKMDTTVEEHTSASETPTSPPVANEQNDSKAQSWWPAMSFTDRFLAVERLSDMLDAFLADRRICVQMLRRPRAGFSMKDHQMMLVETILSAMLQIPRSRNPLLFYATVLVELCRGGDPQTAIHLLQAVETLIREAQRLDPEVTERVAQWLAFHLSHFQWEWNWDAWLPLQGNVHSAALIASMLEYAVRLSYRERIAEKTPSALHNLLVPPAEPVWETESPLIGSPAASLLASIPEPVKVELAQRLVASAYDAVPYLNEHVPKELRPAVFLQALLRGGYGAPSFFANLVERWGGVLRELCRDPGAAAAGLQLVSVVLQVWESSHQHALLSLNCLSSAGILDPSTVVTGVYRQLLNRYPTSDDLSFAALNDLRFPFETVRFFLNQYRDRLRRIQTDIEMLLLAISRAPERDLDTMEAALTRARQMLQQHRQGLKRFLAATLDSLAQILRHYHGSSGGDRGDRDHHETDDHEDHGGTASATSASTGDTAPAALVRGWLLERSLGLVQELLRTQLDQTPRLLGTLKALLGNFTNASLKRMLHDLDQLARWSLATV